MWLPVEAVGLYRVKMNKPSNMTGSEAIIDTSGGLGVPDP